MSSQNFGGVVAISDTHFGRYYRGNFSCREDDLEKFLNWLIHGGKIELLNGGAVQIPVAEQFILCGDIFELWAPFRSEEVFFRSYKFLSALQDLGNKGTEIVYLYGNHDIANEVYKMVDSPLKGVSAPKLWIKEYHSKIINGQTFLFLHGHQIRWHWFSELAKTPSYILQLLAWTGKNPKKILAFLGVVFFPLLTLLAALFSIIGWMGMTLSAIKYLETTFLGLALLFLILYLFLFSVERIRSNLVEIYEKLRSTKAWLRKYWYIPATLLVGIFILFGSTKSTITFTGVAFFLYTIGNVYRFFKEMAEKVFSPKEPEHRDFKKILEEKTFVLEKFRRISVLERWFER